ncbi:MAG: DUF370 domain-containing protein [Nitrospirota bacterium]|nr:DUF370 domain-containing protein [Nitrospirota bacterium]
MINIGFGNVVLASRIISVVSASSAPMKRLKEEAKKIGRGCIHRMGYCTW